MNRLVTHKLHYRSSSIFGFDIIDYAAEQHDKVAFIEVSGDGNSVTSHTFSALKQRSNQAANVLLNKGLARGDFAVVILPRISAWYEVILACIKLGVVSMPGTNLLTAKDLEFRINKSQANTIIVTPEHVAKVEQIKQRCPSLRHFILVGGVAEGWQPYDDDRPKACAELPRDPVGISRRQRYDDGLFHVRNHSRSKACDPQPELCACTPGNGRFLVGSQG